MLLLLCIYIIAQAHQREVPIIPLMMESYTATGWLGLLLGTKLWFSFHPQAVETDADLQQQLDLVERELGARGKMTTAVPPVSQQLQQQPGPAAAADAAGAATDIAAVGAEAAGRAAQVGGTTATATATATASRAPVAASLLSEGTPPPPALALAALEPEPESEQLTERLRQLLRQPSPGRAPASPVLVAPAPTPAPMPALEPAPAPAPAPEPAQTAIVKAPEQPLTPTMTTMTMDRTVSSSAAAEQPASLGLDTMVTLAGGGSSSSRSSSVIGGSEGGESSQQLASLVEQQQIQQLQQRDDRIEAKLEAMEDLLHLGLQFMEEMQLVNDQERRDRSLRKHKETPPPRFSSGNG